jgi:Tfp pilus assembly protein FimT
MRTRGRETGFTVLEILVMITIIALASTISALHIYHSLDSVSLYGASKKLLYTARYARLLAVENHQSCILHIDIDQNSYYLSVQKTGIPVKTHEESEPAAVVNNIYVSPTVLPEKITFGKVQVEGAAPAERGEVKIQYREDGRVEAALIQMGNQQSIYTVLLNPFTAKAELRTEKIETLPVDTVDLDKKESSR